MRPEKTLILEDLQGWVKQSPYLIVADYTGLKVSEFSELRTRLRGAQAEVRVVKNTFLRRALINEQLPDLEKDLNGQTAIVFGPSDVCAAAKILKSFGSEFQRPKVRLGIVDKAYVDGKGVLALADLPSKDALRAQILGLISTPASQLVRLINTPASQLAQVIKAKSDKGS
jgi:large subunit ribosomal protein L10